MSDSPHLADDRRGLIAWFLARPVTVAMGFLALMVVGAIAYQRISIQLLPSGFQPRSLSIEISLRDSTPYEVEQKITRPLERSLGTIAGIKKLTTWSRANGCRARVQFEDSVSINDAYLQVWDRLDRLQPEFPEEAQRPRVRRFNLDAEPILYLAVSVNKGADPMLLRDETLIRSRIENRLLRIDGVAQVTGRGGSEQAVDIALREELVEGMRVDLYQLIQKLQTDNFTMSAGQLTEGRTHHYIRSLARFDTVGELLRYQVKPGLSLNELGTAGLSYAQEWVVRVNGLRSVVLEVLKKSDANTVEIGQKVRHVIATELADDPELKDFQFQVLFDQGDLIMQSIGNLTDTILQGAWVAVLVLLLFLRSLRMTLIVTLAIPVSLMTGLAAMYFMGETLNLISLMGMTLAVGMLVDNAVVVTESIRAQTEAGDAPVRAARVGTQRVGLAVLIATSTTLVVFLPLMLGGDSGMFRFFMLRLGLPVCLALSASLLVAMVLIPPACRYVLSRSAAGPGRLGRWIPGPARTVGRWIDRGLAATVGGLGVAYVWLLRRVLRRRLESLVIACLLFASMFMIPSMQETDMNQGEERGFSVRVRLPDSYTLRDSDGIMTQIEDVVLADRAHYDVKWAFCFFGRRWGFMRIFMTEGAKIKRKRADVIAELRTKMPSLPGVKIDVGDEGREEGGAERSAIPIVLEGRDSELLAVLAEEVVARLKDLPGVDSISTPLDDARPEILIRPDRELAQRYGVDAQRMAGTIAYTYRGRWLPKLRAGDKEYQLRIGFDRDADPRLDEVKALKVWTNTGARVPLGSVARFERRKAFPEIRREDRRTVMRITARTEKKDLKELMAGIQGRLAALRFPDGYGVRKEGRFKAMEEQNDSYKYALGLAIALVFLLMGFLFESLLLPLAILVSIPFAFTGVYWLLYLTDTAWDVMCGIGVVVLIGVVINNGVVLIDRIHSLRRGPCRRFDAIIEGARERFRPVLMTSLTTIGGLIPMAIGDSNIVGVPYFPLGRTVIGGLAAATVMTLFLVPLVYTLLDDLGRYLKSLVTRAA